MSVEKYMSAEVVTANLRDGLHQTLTRMRERSIRHMPVLGEGGALAGIISERDLLRPAFVDDGIDTVSSFTLDNAHTVAQAMTPDPTTISTDTAIGDVVKMFIERKYGALPVLNTDGHLVGILSQVDLLRAFADTLAAS